MLLPGSFSLGIFLLRLDHRKSCLLNKGKLVRHARTEVGENDERNGNALRFEVEDMLFDAVFEDTKVVLGEAGGDAPFIFENDYRNADELRVGNDARDYADLRMRKRSRLRTQKRADCGEKSERRVA